MQVRVALETALQQPIDKAVRGVNDTIELVKKAQIEEEAAFGNLNAELLQEAAAEFMRTAPQAQVVIQACTHSFSPFPVFPSPLCCLWEPLQVLSFDDWDYGTCVCCLSD